MKELICIVCPKGCHLQVDENNGYRVTGNHCPKGAQYGSEELKNPVRTLTTTVAIKGAAHDRLPVRTNKAISKKLLIPCMAEVRKVCVTSPVQAGAVIIPDILGTGADLIASRNL